MKKIGRKTVAAMTAVLICEVFTVSCQRTAPEKSTMMQTESAGTSAAGSEETTVSYAAASSGPLDNQAMPGCNTACPEDTEKTAAETVSGKTAGNRTDAESTTEGKNMKKNPKLYTMQTAPVNRGEINGCGGIQGTVSSFDEKSGKLTIDCTDTTGKTYTLNTADIGDIELKEELSKGLKVALMFQGSLLKAGDDIAKVKAVVLLDAQENWIIDVRSGITTANAMSSFSVKEDGSGKLYEFLKDNCPVDAGVMDNDSGDHVEVTFVTADSGNRYPLRVRTAK